MTACEALISPPLGVEEHSMSPRQKRLRSWEEEEAPMAAPCCLSTPPLTPEEEQSSSPRAKRPRLAVVAHELASRPWGHLIPGAAAVAAWERPPQDVADVAGHLQSLAASPSSEAASDGHIGAAATCVSKPLRVAACAAACQCSSPASSARALHLAQGAEHSLAGAADGPAAAAGPAVPPTASRRPGKGSANDWRLLRELPPKQSEIVRLALEQWGRLRHRVMALEPTLRREGALVQEILDTGFRDESTKTLRKLTQRSSENGDVEKTIQQVGKSIGANRERLERILERNHGELVRLSTTAVSDLKEDVLREVDEVLGHLKAALGALREELHDAKERADMSTVRRTGMSFNDLKALVRELDSERRLITKNSARAALLVTVCRRVLPVRRVDPSALRDIPPSCEGYRRILDFYFFTDAGLYYFGDYTSGPNWFVRLKRNIAILLVQDVSGKIVYNHFAVSGEHRAPGAPPAPSCGPLRPTDAEDEYGRVFNRQHDAEFKLLSEFCVVQAATLGSEGSATWEGTGTLWSRKPICGSCLGAVRQVAALFPNLQITVSEGSVTRRSMCRKHAGSEARAEAVATPFNAQDHASAGDPTPISAPLAMCDA